MTVAFLVNKNTIIQNIMHTPSSSILAFGLGMPELVIIFFVLLLMFGAKKLPELARGMGKAINEFKRASAEVEKEIKNGLDTEPTKEHGKEPKLANYPTDVKHN